MLGVPAKSVLSARFENGWFASSYNMNLYRGCCHGCIYCDSRSECYHIDNFDTVREKENALSILEGELRSKRKRGVVISGSMSDCYNPFEAERKLTRGALELFVRYGFGAASDTKSPLAARDADLYLEIQKKAPAAVSFTITCADDALCSRIEPRVAPTSKRLDAIAELSSRGVMCGAQLMPVLPFITDSRENLLAIPRMVKEAGGRWVFIYKHLGVTLRQNQRLHFLNEAEKLFPGMKARYIASYGEEYSCTVPQGKALLDELIPECERLGLLWRMSDISRALLAPYESAPCQLALF